MSDATIEPAEPAPSILYGSPSYAVTLADVPDPADEGDAAPVEG